MASSSSVSSSLAIQSPSSGSALSWLAGWAGDSSPSSQERTEKRARPLAWRGLAVPRLAGEGVGGPLASALMGEPLAVALKLAAAPSEPGEELLVAA